MAHSCDSLHDIGSDAGGLVLAEGDLTSLQSAIIADIKPGTVSEERLHIRMVLMVVGFHPLHIFRGRAVRACVRDQFHEGWVNQAGVAFGSRAALLGLGYLTVPTGGIHVHIHAALFGGVNYRHRGMQHIAQGGCPHVELVGEGWVSQDLACVPPLVGS